ncbi:MAG: HAD-IA family hydrolase [Thiocapsa sp.]|nr:HAD-IA family hydrolase [Thiocapsa sp.]MCG6984293.1 HAD-IA family hydrolase [Thiocapsa sp.]
MTFELIVFDWDGTLMDSEARIVNCLQAACCELGVPSPPHASARDVIGLGLDEAVMQLLPGADSATRRAIMGRYRQHFLETDRTPSLLFPGVRETLGRLSGEGYRLAVATGKGRVGLDRALADTGLRDLFLATRCADETLSKPHPQMLLELMDELGVDPAQTLMVGDTEYDMQMASNARTQALAVAYGVHAPERLMLHGPLDCLDTLSGLPEWLARNGRRDGARSDRPDGGQR